MLRSYVPTDLDDVTRIWLASTIQGQPFVSEADWRAMEPQIRDELMPIAQTSVIEVDGELVAFMSIIDHTIGGLFTLPEHQGKGYGGALVEHARHSVSPLFVEMFDANERAMRFYRG